MTATLALEGFVAPHVPADDAWDGTGMTTRVGGEDLLLAVTEAAKEVKKPITASLVIDHDTPIVGDLHINRGYEVPGVFCDTEDEDEDGPCDCTDDTFCPAMFEVGDVDILRLLEAREGDQVQLEMTLAGPKPARVLV